MAKRFREKSPLSVFIASIEEKFMCLPLDLLELGAQAILVSKTMRADAAAVRKGNDWTMREDAKLRQRIGNGKRRAAASQA